MLLAIVGLVYRVLGPMICPALLCFSVIWTRLPIHPFTQCKCVVQAGDAIEAGGRRKQAMKAARRTIATQLIAIWGALVFFC